MIHTWYWYLRILVTEEVLHITPICVWGVQTSHLCRWWAVVLIWISSSTESNGDSIIPLQQTTLVCKYYISISPVGYQNSLKGVLLSRKQGLSTRKFFVNWEPNLRIGDTNVRMYCIIIYHCHPGSLKFWRPLSIQVSVHFFEKVSRFVNLVRDFPIPPLVSTSSQNGAIRYRELIPEFPGNCWLLQLLYGVLNDKSPFVPT